MISPLSETVEPVGAVFHKEGLSPFLEPLVNVVTSGDDPLLPTLSLP